MAAEIANLEVGNPNFGKGANLHDSVSAKQAAEQLKVSERTVKTAKKVKKQGALELQQVVEYM